MADILRIKRRVSGSPGAPTSLANAELAYNEVDHTLYYGEGTGGAGGTATVVVPIGGSGLGSSASPLMDGTAAAGTASLMSRADHVHPTDTTRLAASAYTAADVLAKLLTVDGSGSGLDADTLDGLNSSAFATTAALGSYVKVDGTVAMTGPLSITPASGGTLLTLQPTAGQANAVLKSADNSANLIVDKSTATSAASVRGRRNGVDRWVIDLGNTTTESGSNSGSNFTIWPYDDGGTPGSPALSITRSDGLCLVKGDPTSPTGIATKQYVDSVAQGLDAKASVKAASTANLTLSAAQTVDGVSLVAGDRCLVKNQTNPQENGIYLVASGAWTRSTDLDTWAEVPGAYVWVEQGTTQADTGWISTADAGGTINTTAMPWTQFSGAALITAGGGMTKTGNTLDVVGTAGRISVLADSIDIDSAYVGQASITTLGTVTTGTWSATTIAVNKGGTGAVTLTGYVKGNGTSPFTANATIPNTDITGLGTMSTQNANAVAITGGTIDGITFDMGTF